jgi:nucleoid-associated protein YgaU
MLHFSIPRFIVAISFAPASLFAASAPSDLAQEYEQVRRIALRDPKVRAAYAAADQRLDEKIVKIDPSLAGYVKARRNRDTQTQPPATRPSPSNAPRKVALHPRGEILHVVAKGDTLISIAAKHHVSVADLRRANRIQDERRLPVGQTLTIPRGR